MTRKVDELGRIVLPIEYRQALDISEKDDLIKSPSENQLSVVTFANPQ